VPARRPAGRRGDHELRRRGVADVDGDGPGRTHAPAVTGTDAWKAGPW
jgi:hypothetical protein